MPDRSNTPVTTITIIIIINTENVFPLNKKNDISTHSDITRCREPKTKHEWCYTQRCYVGTLSFWYEFPDI